MVTKMQINKVIGNSLNNRKKILTEKFSFVEDYISLKQKGINSLTDDIKFLADILSRDKEFLNKNMGMFLLAGELGHKAMVQYLSVGSHDIEIIELVKSLLISRRNSCETKECEELFDSTIASVENILARFGSTVDETTNDIAKEWFSIKLHTSNIVSAIGLESANGLRMVNELQVYGANINYNPNAIDRCHKVLVDLESSNDSNDVADYPKLLTTTTNIVLGLNTKGANKIIMAFPTVMAEKMVLFNVKERVVNSFLSLLSTESGRVSKFVQENPGGNGFDIATEYMDALSNATDILNKYIKVVKECVVVIESELNNIQDKGCPCRFKLTHKFIDDHRLSFDEYFPNIPNFYLPAICTASKRGDDYMSNFMAEQVDKMEYVLAYIENMLENVTDSKVANLMKNFITIHIEEFTKVMYDIYGDPSKENPMYKYIENIKKLLTLVDKKESQENTNHNNSINELVTLESYLDKFKMDSSVYTTISDQLSNMYSAKLLDVFVELRYNKDFDIHTYADTINSIINDIKSAGIKLTDEDEIIISEAVSDTLIKGAHNLQDMSQKVYNSLKGFGSTVNRITTPIKKIPEPLINGIRDSIENMVKEWEQKKREDVIKGGWLNKFLGVIRKSIHMTIGYGIGSMVNPLVGLLGSFVAMIISDAVDDSFRHKVVHELETELEILEEKLNDASSDENKENKYKLMRLRAALKRDIQRVKFNM